MIFPRMGGGGAGDLEQRIRALFRDFWIADDGN